ncbi:biopolymer transporter ExbD [Deferribacter thermophilus]|uniref:ExbD/TolR family protein n=1 Tax=Deferribacter thermophilus TaxID=53573 RepID=UPI003C1ED3AB
MKFSKREKNAGLDINLTPLIDVVFLLLIFFMVSTTFIYTNALKVDLPKAKGDEQTINKSIVIVINNNNEIFLNEKKISKFALYKTLLDLKKKSENLPIILQADKDAKHGTVVYVMDQCKKAGFDRFTIAVEEE